MNRKIFPLVACVMAILLGWGYHPASTRANGPSRGAHSASHVGVLAKLPLHVSLSAPSVRQNAEERLVLQTVPGASVALRVVYPQTGGFKAHGKANKRGKYSHRWAVHADHPGRATVKLVVTHGRDTRHYTVHFAVVAAATPTALPTSTPAPTATSAPTSTPSSTAMGTPAPVITLQGLSFYSAASSSGPIGDPQSSFATGTGTIYAYAQFSQWQGYHEVTFNWYDPNGNLYYTSTDRSTDSGPAGSLSSIDVAGQPAASRTGSWTVTVVADGRALSTQQFTLYAGVAPSPTAGTAIVLQGLGLYTDVGSTGPLGTPQTTFSPTTATIYAYATYSDWEGQHAVTFNWYAPDGSLYQTYTDQSTDSGPSADYDGLDVAGQDAARATGTWRVELVIDGRVATSQQFTIQ